MKLLLIEDDSSIANPLIRVFKKKGVLADWEKDGALGYEAALLRDYDCIILDLNLPSIDGLEICKKLRLNNVLTPILMLTARSQVYNTLEGFASGADDYVSKPFDLSILIARINALILRSRNINSQKLKFNSSSLNFEKNTIKIESGEEILLSSKEMGVLRYLILNKGRVVSTVELLQHVWDSEIDLFTDTVKTHIKTLRQKIDPAKSYIKTVHGKGYILSD